MCHKRNPLTWHDCAVGSPLYFVGMAILAFSAGLWDVAGGVKIVHPWLVVAGVGCWALGGTAVWYIPRAKAIQRHFREEEEEDS